MTQPTDIVVSAERQAAPKSVAEPLGRSSQEFLDEMIDNQVEYERYFREQVEAGLADLDAGRIASDEEVAAFFDRL